MLPEMNLKGLSQDGVTLPSLFQQRACTPPEILKDADLDFIRSRIAAGFLPLHRSPNSARLKIYTRDSKPSNVTSGNEKHPDIARQLEAGTMIEAHVWEPMMHRQESIQMTLAAVADEFRTEVVKDTEAFLTMAPAWLPPGSQLTSQAELERAWEADHNRVHSIALTRRAAISQREGVNSDASAETAEPDASLLHAADARKREGNDLFQRRSCRAAMRCYTEAIDKLRIARPSEAVMSTAVKQTLSTLLSNRAQCAIDLANEHSESAPSLLRAVICDCTYLLENKQFSGTNVLPAVRKKLEHRHAVAIDRLSGLQLRTDATAEATIVVLKAEEMTGAIDGFATDACTICMDTWDGELQNSYAVMLPCKHTLCANCLVNWQAECNRPRKPPPHKPPPDFSCVECRTAIPRRAVDELAAGVVSSDDSLTLLTGHLGCDAEVRCQIVRSLLVQHKFNVPTVEDRLWEMLQAHETAVVARLEPLQAKEKQRIYEDARRPVKALETDLVKARSELRKVRADESNEAWCKLRANVSNLEQQLKAARLNAAQEIFAQMNADGLGMGEEGAESGECVLDFHGLHAKETESLAVELFDCVLPALRSLVIITGRGAHSAGGRTVLRPTIECLV